MFTYLLPHHSPSHVAFRHTVSEVEHNKRGDWLSPTTPQATGLSGTLPPNSALNAIEGALDPYLFAAHVYTKIGPVYIIYTVSALRNTHEKFEY